MEVKKAKSGNVCSKERFIADIENHEMTVLMDDGLYRQGDIARDLETMLETCDTLRRVIIKQADATADLIATYEATYNKLMSWGDIKKAAELKEQVDRVRRCQEEIQRELARCANGR